MFKEENLNTSIFDHFYTFYKRKSICIITDKQLVFISYRNNILDTHLNGLKYINKNVFGIEDDSLINLSQHINIITNDRTMQIILPHRTYLTPNEHKLLMYYLEEINEVSDFININITLTGNHVELCSTNSVDEIIDIVKLIEVKEMNKTNTFEEIIGITVDDLNSKKKIYHI